MLTDTHVHFDDAAARGETAALLERAMAAGVTRFLSVGGNPSANTLALALAARAPGRVRAAVGLDRDQADAPWDITAVETAARAPETAAVGEIGLDYHYGLDRRADQLRRCETMLDLAARAGRPVVLHSRAADEDTLALLGAHAARRGAAPPGVLHCFTGGRNFAFRLLDLGFFVSFSGILTFANAGELRAVAAAVPEDRLLIETDTPYLAPVPHRGRPNEPAWLAHVAATLAALRNRAPDEIARITSRNAERLFGPWTNHEPSHE